MWEQCEGSVNFSSTSTFLDAVSICALQEQQGILLNMEMHQTVLNLLHVPWGVEMRPIFSQAYQFLTLFCLGNPRNQQAVYDEQKQDLITQHYGLDVHAEDCMQSIFVDNYELCNKVDEHLVTLHVGLISYSEGKTMAHVAFLKTIGFVNGIPLSRNQDLILYSLMAHEIAIPDSINGLLADSTLRTIVAIVELLALCCMGQNTQVANIVNAYLQLDSVLAVLADTEHPLAFQQEIPFMRYLVNAFWSQELRTMELESMRFMWARSPQWWAVVQKFCDFIADEIMSLTKDCMLPEDVAVRVDYLCDCVLYGLSEYVKIWWRAGEENASSRHAQMKINEIVSLLAEIVQDSALIERMDMQTRHFSAIANFITVLDNNGAHDTQDADVLTIIEECENYTKQASVLEDSDLSSSITAVSAEAVAAGIRASFIQLRKEFHSRYYTPSVDDLPLFLEILTPYLSQKMISALLGHLENVRLPESVRTGILQLFTLVITRAITSEFDLKLEKKQALIKVQSQYNTLGASELMTKLVSSNSPLVARHALKFGIALLHGGNTKIQDTLLKYFETTHSGFFGEMTSFLRKFEAELRQRKAESAMAQTPSLPHSPTVEERSDWSETEYIPAQAVLRLLQLLCEGHHLNMQNMIRSQKNIPSFDMINEVIVLVFTVTHWSPFACQIPHVLSVVHIILRFYCGQTVGEGVVR